MTMSRHASTLLPGLLLLGLTACQRGEPAQAAPAAPAYPRTTVIETYGQGAAKLELVRFQASPRDDAFLVRQGDKVILDAPGRVLGIVAAVPSKEQPRFLLAEINHSGNRCPLWYRIIDLRGATPQVTREDFGTCWRIKGEPTELNGANHVELFGDRSGATLTSFWIKDGEVIKVPTVKGPAKAPVKPPPAPAK
jgi:hypothetical protein